jgi:imidazolonepropionase-like amidohydrolase
VSAALWAILVLTGGTVSTGEGAPIEDATVVIDGGRVTAVGHGLPVPAGAQVIDCHGKQITPGLIDPFTRLGLVEIPGVDEARDVDAGGGDPVRAAFRAADAFDPDSGVIPVQRAYGVTTVGSAPDGGLVSGQMGVFSLGDPPGPVLESAAVVVRLGQDGGSSRGERLLKLREVLDDARAWQANRKAFEENRFRKTAASRLDLEALIPVVQGKTPLAVEMNRASDIRNLLKLAADEKIRVMLIGGAEAWRVAPELAAAKVPVVVDPGVNLPYDFDRLHARADNAALLDRAGVRVVLSTFDVHRVRKLRQWAGNAVRAGLPHAAAPEAVTSRAADALGVPDRGRLTPGKAADVVVWSGDPFELSSRVEHLIIGGREVSTMNRQQALFERYRKGPPP